MMKKDCSNCEHLCREGYEDYYYICEVFGDDVPKWAINPINDSCLLKEQEIKKMIRLANEFLVVGTSNECDEFGCPKRTKEDVEHNQKVMKEYNAYIELLKKRCENRKIAIICKN